eukprot:TRINITY_DN623_c0_g1_i1.p1 TRINITY_DN623_c0_g1~~TRINITY_DN623_c0_g1_i1.p1  ORF type:complete len:276 (-),score=88.52 TRINITY_DN623_c0_g1_i1:341-1123(-)
MTPGAHRLLVENYRKLREGDIGPFGKTAYRITVRQLESMIRLSEALARVHLDSQLTEAYVSEAFRLLKKSIIQIHSDDVILPSSTTGEPIHLSSHSDHLQENLNPQTTSEPKSEEPKATPKSVTLSFEKYKAIADRIIDYMRRKSEGLKQKEILNWYLEEYIIPHRHKKSAHFSSSVSQDQTSQEMQPPTSQEEKDQETETQEQDEDEEEEETITEEQILMEAKLIRGVINRLVNQDKVLIPLTETDEIESRILVVHPNY